MKNKLLLLIAFFASTGYIFALDPPTPPGGGGGEGTDGFGTPSAPIDLYLLFLVGIAVVFIAIYSKKFIKSY